MGSGYVYHCPDCGEATYIALGMGSDYTPERVFYGNHADPPLMKDFLSAAMYRTADRLLRDGGVPDTAQNGSYGQKLYYFPQCRTLKVGFFCTIIHDDRCWTPQYTCDLCQHPLVLVPNQENGDDPSRDQMAGPDGAVLRICCKKCGRVYFAPESGCTSVFLWD